MPRKARRMGERRESVDCAWKEAKDVRLVVVIDRTGVRNCGLHFLLCLLPRQAFLSSCRVFVRGKG